MWKATRTYATVELSTRVSFSVVGVFKGHAREIDICTQHCVAQHKSPLEPGLISRAA
jgi:hypothetical protein